MKQLGTDSTDPWSWDKTVNQEGPKITTAFFLEEFSRLQDKKVEPKLSGIVSWEVEMD